jgi:dTDP-4-dehydrorhamnose 3,5-epimerase
MIELDEEAWIIVFIPSGLAHGFAAVSDSVLMAYATTTVYDPDREGGIRWDSVGIPWSDSDPILSTRDLALPAFADYQSRFTYRG